MNPDSRIQPRCGVLRLQDFAALRVSGEDRVEFLQGQLTQDMGKVTPTQAAPAAWCNRQGRVLCLMVAVDWRDAIFLVLPAEMAEACISGLKRYILRAKVRIEHWDQAAGDEGGTPSFPGVFGCSGPADLDGEAWSCEGHEAFCAVRLPGTGDRALLLGEPPADLKVKSRSGWTAEEWRLADIEAELPWIGEKTSGKFLAHSLNLDLSGAVSFTKGCFVGQEIIARMEYRGTPKRRMQRVRIEGGSTVQAGARLDLPGLGAATVIARTTSQGHIEALAEIRLAESSG
ncbi:MAG: hypothetical protein OXC70_04825 [Gammaproteobacteria bacterium]|nr:hypothetical protein [Gammaproteobacteria bacterium]